MPRPANALVWDGRPGHYEVYYLTLTDPTSGVGFWIRYTLLAPRPESGLAAEGALWLLAMDPRHGRPPVWGRRIPVPAEAVRYAEDPSTLRIGDARLTGESATGSVGDGEWDLRFAPSPLSFEHVHPIIRAARAAQTVLMLPQADLRIDGHVRIGDETITLHSVPGAQAHLWGTAHARRWVWVHCNDFCEPDGTPRPGTVLDAVSVFVRRGGREIGPNTPVVGRIDGEDFISTSPLRVLGNRSRLALTGCELTATDGRRRIIVEVDADRRHLAGVTYHDPDGSPAYCYNSEIASLRLHVLHRARRVGGWAHRETLISSGRAHFEYAQRTPVPGVELVV